ncbi:3-dehydroquinate synthase [Fictibacillus fluitans]|uniref:3-dehydroquinate synthase n=1 Tax=Fictibacillus fluitans TaxID=3058422 RepID=A0ABT8HQW0_9BACL|nr:3-dehydroquinate synthase [Fictibacillus sp. NE201]MDN4523154.1 3-dehydroquinate synthase [Fictibacillus sp. NE201]
METLHVQTDTKQYPVLIGNKIITDLSPLIEELKPAVTSVLILSDETVGALYMDKAVESLKGLNQPVHTFVVPGGDGEKSFSNYYNSLTFALEKGLDRNSLIVALGGGMIGDLAGFVAGTYMRGIRFIQLPTTLLAHDSAVGGKTGINHPLGKNMVGVFHQPEAVFYSIDFLDSLPLPEIRSGFAEVIKHALIQDEEFYDYLKGEISDLSDIPPEKLSYILKKGISIKAKVVSQDEKEKGLRAILNFGHTLGHAIESESGYGTISHGDAVAIGMRFALQLSEELGDTNLHYKEISNWLKHFNYPSVPSKLDAERLLGAMKRDKKSTSGRVKMVLLEAIGQPYVKEVEDCTLLNALKKFLMTDKEK